MILEVLGNPYQYELEKLTRENLAVVRGKGVIHKVKKNKTIPK